jgi:hypothetical protein
MRYFLSSRANRPLEVNGRKYSFDPVGFTAGNFLGVYAADGGHAEADLATAVQRRLAVDEISQADYDTLKKKQPATPSSSRSLASPAPRAVETPRPPSSLSMTDRPGAVSAESATPRTGLESPANELPSIDDIIKIERVSSPEMIVDPTERVGNAVEKTPRKRKAKS